MNIFDGMQQRLIVAQHIGYPSFLEIIALGNVCPQEPLHLIFVFGHGYAIRWLQCGLQAVNELQTNRIQVFHVCQFAQAFHEEGGLGLIDIFLFVQEGKEIVHHIIRHLKGMTLCHLPWRGNRSMAVTETGGIVKEQAVAGQGIADIHFLTVGQHNIRQYTTGRITLQFLTALLRSIVYGLYAPARWEIIVRRGYLEVTAIGDRTNGLHQSLTESTLTHNGGTLQLLQTTGHNLRRRGC